MIISPFISGGRVQYSVGFFTTQRGTVDSEPGHQHNGSSPCLHVRSRVLDDGERSGERSGAWKWESSLQTVAGERDVTLCPSGEGQERCLTDL